jgi:hypothetical protein
MAEASGSGPARLERQTGLIQMFSGLAEEPAHERDVEPAPLGASAQSLLPLELLEHPQEHPEEHQAGELVEPPAEWPRRTHRARSPSPRGSP